MKRLLPLAALFLTLCLSACSGGYTAQEPCAYCGVHYGDRGSLLRL